MLSSFEIDTKVHKFLTIIQEIVISTVGLVNIEKTNKQKRLLCSHFENIDCSHKYMQVQS